MQMANTRADLIEQLKALKEQGFRCWIVKDDEWEHGYIEVNNRMLYVQCDYYGGYTFTFVYIPSKNNGSGCQCLTHAVDEIKPEVVNKALREGMAYARKLRAIHYKDSNEFMNTVRLGKAFNDEYEEL